MSDRADLTNINNWVCVADPDHSKDDTQFVETYFGKDVPVLTREMEEFRGIGDYSLLRLPRAVRRLALTRCHGVTLNNLLPATLECLWLANIRLTNFTFLPAGLRFLDLTNTGVRDPSFINFPSLEHLVLDKTDTDGTCFNTLPKGLRWLSLKGCPITKWDRLTANVVWLDVRGCEPLRATDHFQTMSSLRHLLMSPTLDTSWRPETLQSLGQYQRDEWSVLVSTISYPDNQPHPQLEALVKVVDAGGGGLFFDGVIPRELRPHIMDWFVDNLPNTVERLDLSECSIRWPSLNHWPTGLRRLKAPAGMTLNALKKLPQGLEDLTLQVDTLDVEMLEALPSGLMRFEFTAAEGPPLGAFDPLLRRGITLIPNRCTWWIDD